LVSASKPPDPQRQQPPQPPNAIQAAGPQALQVDPIADLIARVKENTSLDKTTIARPP